MSDSTQTYRPVPSFSLRTSPAVFLFISHTALRPVAVPTRGSALPSFTRGRVRTAMETV
jgi:hypothetical protein